MHINMNMNTNVNNKQHELSFLFCIQDYPYGYNKMGGEILSAGKDTETSGPSRFIIILL
jgi:C1A family cysteine protease